MYIFLGNMRCKDVLPPSRSPHPGRKDKQIIHVIRALREAWRMPRSSEGAFPTYPPQPLFSSLYNSLGQSCPRSELHPWTPRCAWYSNSDLSPELQIHIFNGLLGTSLWKLQRILKAMPAHTHFLLTLQFNFLSQIPSKQGFRMGIAAVNHTTGQGKGKICELQFILLLFNWKKFKLEDDCFTMLC